MNFKKILYFGFAAVILLMVIILTTVILVLNNQSERMNALVEDRYEKIQLANELRTSFNTIKSGVDIETYSSENEVPKRVQEAFHNINENLRELEKSINTEEGRYLIDQIDTVYKEYKIAADAIFLQLSGNEQFTETQLLDKLRIQQSQLEFDIEELITLQESIMNESLAASESTYKTVVTYLLLLTLSGIIIGAAAAYWVIFNIRERLLKLTRVMGRLTFDTGVLPKVEMLSKDEIGEIAAAYNEMAITLEEHIRVEQTYQEEIEEQNWLKTKVAELSVLTQGNLTLQRMGDVYIQKLSEIIGASHGVFYLTKSNGHEDYLVLCSGYAYGERLNENELAPSFLFGEGLIGQAAKDNKVVHSNDIPENYIQIRSGLGKTLPKSLIILPIELEGEVVGVLELAALHELTNQHLKLLEQVTDHLGVTINRITKHMQVQELLEESQTLNEELQTQSEELQLQQEELKTMNDELEAQYKHSEMKTKQLEQIKFELEEKTKEIMLSSQYKSEFLANMSHELRTPLNSLLILGQMLAENKEGNLTKTQIDYAKTIYSSGNDLLNLINDILDLSKIESGKMDILDAEVDLNSVLAAIKQQFHPIADKKGIQFSLSKNDSVPAILFSDEQKIIQILRNLLSNAFKFTEKGSVHLDIGSKNVSGENGQLKEYIAFSVLDTGIGIPQEKVRFIFEAFNQADGTTSRKYGGTGLGLSICKELASLLGGFIEVETKEGAGSKFTFYLPQEEKSAEDNSQDITITTCVTTQNGALIDTIDKSSTLDDETIHNDIMKAKKILIVDDDMRNIFALTSALEAEDMKVVFAENGN